MITVYFCRNSKSFQQIQVYIADFLSHYCIISFIYDQTEKDSEEYIISQLIANKKIFNGKFLPNSLTPKKVDTERQIKRQIKQHIKRQINRQIKRQVKRQIKFNIYKKKNK